jgi:hypothetical protein
MAKGPRGRRETCVTKLQALDMASPMKSLSVRSNTEGKSSLHVKTGENRYKSIANFAFNIVCFVDFGKRYQHLNGYIFDVTRVDEQTM